MITESLIKKVNFVNELSVAICKVQRNVKKISYEVYEHSVYGKQEYLIIAYDGGAMSCRNCNGNSCSAVLEEITKYLEHGYYAEVEDYLQLCDDKNWIRLI